MQTNVPGKDAELFTALPNGRIKCTACARLCEIPEGKIGLCGIRGVVNSKLRLFVYGRVIAGHIDPIEKKPVIHYMPGTDIFSISTTGCNWLCQYCQNYDISQRRKVEGAEMTPAQVAETAAQYGSQGIAYTYNEPSIFIEFARDCGIEAHKRGIFNIFVSNGYDTPESVGMMGQFLDCITVDFKGSGEQKFVRRYIGIPSSDPIFQTLKEIRDRTKIHVEITDLIVPQVGDDLFRSIARLPGLAADDISAQFWVRGAPHSQLLARLDGVVARCLGSGGPRSRTQPLGDRRGDRTGRRTGSVAARSSRARARRGLLDARAGPRHFRGG